MQRRHPRQVASHLADKAQATAQQLQPKLPDSSAVQGSPAQTLINKLRKPPFAGTSAGQALLQYIEAQRARGADLEEFKEDVTQKAREELDRRRQLVAPLVEVLNLIRGADAMARLRTEVIQPVRARVLRTQEAWERVNNIIRMPFPFLTWAERQFGPVTIALGLKVQGGLAGGIGGYEGISGLRHHCACHYLSGSLGLGAIAEAEAGVQLSVSPGLPGTAWGVTVEVDMGGGVAATAEVAVSFKPKPRRPTLKDQRIFDYAFDSIAVSLGGGEGLDVSVDLAVTRSVVLIGTAS